MDYAAQEERNLFPPDLAAASSVLDEAGGVEAYWNLSSNLTGAIVAFTPQAAPGALKYSNTQST